MTYTVRSLEPYTVNDLPGDGPRLFQQSEGMHYTVVNGSILTRGNEHTGNYPGQLLRGKGGMSRCIG